jgi:hypothetical protein
MVLEGAEEIVDSVNHCVVKNYENNIKRSGCSI